MQGLSRASIATLLVAVALAAACAVARDVPRPRFIETYAASGEGGLKMRLQLLKPLASLPTKGWLNSADELVADGRFGGSVKRPLNITSKPDFVVLEAEKRGSISAGRYAIENGVLTVCMLSLGPGTYRNVREMAVPENYTLCAAMKKEG